MPTYQSDLVKNRVRLYAPPVSGQVFVRESFFDASAYFADNDVIEMVPVREGERVLEVHVFTEESLATDGTCDVGDADDVDRYIDGSAPLAEGGWARLGNGITNNAAAAKSIPGHRYAKDDTIDVHVDVTTAKASGGHGKIRMRAWLVGS